MSVNPAPPPLVTLTEEERARAVYQTGWRPPVADGPSRDELAAIIRSSRLVAA